MTRQTLNPLPLDTSHCARNYAPPPVVLARGEGIYVWDEDGRRYIDMLGAYSAASFGHCHPRLVEALTRQARRLDTISRAFASRNLYAFLDRACALTGFDCALPMNSGAEAVETALKAARKWGETRKNIAPDMCEIIAAEGNFHGRTIAITALSTIAQYRTGFGPFPPGFKTVPFGDAAALEAAITPHTAAFLVEPIQGEGGIIVPPEGYLRQVREICERHNVLLIADEIQTGLGRTGTLLATDHEGIRADAITLGKALGGGLVPVSLFLARQDVMDVFTPGDHGSTFGGNPLAAAVGLAALDLLVEQDLPQRSKTLGAHMLARLKELRPPVVRDIRGRGLFIGVELDPARLPARKAVHILLRHGILTQSTHRNTIRFAPPLTITQAQLDQALDRIRAAFREMAARSDTGKTRAPPPARVA